MPRIFFVDNFDSFTYNLVQALRVLGAEVTVKRNNAITVEEVLASAPDHLVIGPGPGTPDNAGIATALIRACLGTIPLLGVCLGHQALAVACGGRIVRAGVPMHGKTSPIAHTSTGVFSAMPNPFPATRYHSLVVERETLPPCLEVTAETADGEIMGIRHRAHLAVGVQFHPESILCPAGPTLLSTFLRLKKEK